MSDPVYAGDRVRFRPAVVNDAVALRDLERGASLAALDHIFPPEEYPYPDDDVLRRWRGLLTSGECTVAVAEDNQGLACLIAFDDDLVRHLAVRPDMWGRGYARAALELAAVQLGPSRLWVLEENHSAIAVYLRLGWHPTRNSRLAEWAPFPAEIELVKDGGDLGPG